MRKLLLFTTLLFLGTFTATAQQYIVDCSTFIEHGAMKTNRAVNSYNWLSVEVNFLDTGTFIFSTDVQDSVYFNDTIYVEQTGLQLVNLRGYGMPTNRGAHIFTLNNNCTLETFISNCYVPTGYSYQNIGCHDDSSGYINVNVDPDHDNGPYIYSWNNGLPNQATVYNLTSQLYQVTVYDADSCTTAQDITPSPAPGTTLEVDTFFQVCEGDSLSIMATSEVWKYSFSWKDVNGNILQLDHLSNESTYSFLPDSSITLFLYESWNCTSDPVSIEVQVLENPVAPQTDSSNGANSSTQTYEICIGESIVLDATCSEDVLWFTDNNDLSSPIFTGASFNVSPSVHTTYYAYCSNGVCIGEDFATFNVIVNEPQNLPLAQDQVEACEGELVELDASSILGNGLITWYGELDPNSTPLGTGNLPVTAQGQTTYYAYTNNGECNSLAGLALTLTTTTFFGDVDGQTQYETCPGEEITLDASGNGDIVWYENAAGTGNIVGNGDTINVYPTQTTTYFAVATQDGCLDVDLALPVTVEVSNTPGALLLTDSFLYTICAGVEFDINSNGVIGTDLVWYNTTDIENASPLHVGDVYSVTPENIGYNHTLTYYAFTSSNGTCLDGTYSQVELDVLNAPAVPTGDTLYNTCAGQEVVLTADNQFGGMICWFTNPEGTGMPAFIGNNFSVTPSQGETYYVYIEFGNGCFSPQGLEVNVEVSSSVFAVQDTITDIICHDETLTLSVNTSGGATVQWFTSEDRDPSSLVHVGNPFVVNPQPQSTNPIETIEYYGYASNGITGCYSENFTYVNITYLHALDAPVGQTEYTICEGESITMYAEGIQVSATCWFDTDPPIGAPLMIDEYYTVSPTVTTTYYAFSEFAIGCLSPALPVTVIVEDCAADTLTAGTCTGCESEVNVVFTDCSCIEVESCKELSNVVLALSNGEEYKYDNLSGHQGTFCSPNSFDIIGAWVKSGCYQSGDGPGYGYAFESPLDCGGPTRFVNIAPVVVVFSPNNDGIEDEVQIGSPEMTNYYVEIFNMSGQLIKIINDYNDGWDGRDVNGKIQPNGFYVYVLQADGVKEKRLIGVSK